MKRIPFPPLKDARAPLPREGEVGGCHSRRGRHKTPRNAPGGMEVSNERGRHGRIFANVERRDQRSGRSWRLSRSRRWLTFLVGQFINISPSLVFFSRLSGLFSSSWFTTLSIRTPALTAPVGLTTPTGANANADADAALFGGSSPCPRLRPLSISPSGRCSSRPRVPPDLVLGPRSLAWKARWSVECAGGLDPSPSLRPSVRCCCPGPTSSSLGRRRFPLASEAAAQQRETSAAASRVERSRSRIV